MTWQACATSTAACDHNGAPVDSIVEHEPRVSFQGAHEHLPCPGMAPQLVIRLQHALAASHAHLRSQPANPAGPYSNDACCSAFAMPFACVGSSATPAPLPGPACPCWSL